MKTLRLDIWSDIACPWCYVGKRRLERALARFEHADHVEVVWRSFELDPSAPREFDRSVPYAERLAKKYRTSVTEAERMIERMTAIAAAEGLAMRFDIIRPSNTFDAHRVLHLARIRGVQDAVEERLFAGYLCEGASMGDHETLIRLGAEAGLEADEVAAVLASDAYTADVRRDEAQAAALGIHGVPCFVFAETFGVSGAQPVETMTRALEKAWAELAAAPVEGAVCTPEGC